VKDPVPAKQSLSTNTETELLSSALRNTWLLPSFQLKPLLHKKQKLRQKKANKNTHKQTKSTNEKVNSEKK